MYTRGCLRACGLAAGARKLLAQPPTHHICSYQNATGREIEDLRVQALGFGVPFLLLFGGAFEAFLAK